MILRSITDDAFCWAAEEAQMNQTVISLEQKSSSLCKACLDRELRHDGTATPAKERCGSANSSESTPEDEPDGSFDGCTAVNHQKDVPFLLEPLKVVVAASEADCHSSEVKFTDSATSSDCTCNDGSIDCAIAKQAEKDRLRQDFKNKLWRLLMQNKVRSVCFTVLGSFLMSMLGVPGRSETDLGSHPGGHAGKHNNLFVYGTMQRQ